MPEIPIEAGGLIKGLDGVERYVGDTRDSAYATKFDDMLTDIKATDQHQLTIRGDKERFYTFLAKLCRKCGIRPEDI